MVEELKRVGVDHLLAFATEARSEFRNIEIVGVFDLDWVANAVFDSIPVFFF